jgi:hypothetical protein
MNLTNQPKQKLPNLPNATLVLIFGILSIIVCNFIGLGFGITSLIMSGKLKAILKQSPDSYSPSSIGMVKAGKTCAIIGVIISAIVTILIILYFMAPDDFFTPTSIEYEHFDD